MSERGSVIELAKRGHAAVVGPLGLLLVESLDKSQGLVRADADIVHRVKAAIPSTFVASEVSDDIIGHKSEVFDTTFAAGGIALTAGLASKTSTARELWTLGPITQVAATIGDGIVANTSLMSHAEKSQLDVGPSADESAFGFKFLLDQFFSSEGRAKKTWGVAAGSFAVGMTVIASYIDRKNGTLDATSHGIGLAAGGVASLLKRRRQLNSLGNDTATEALVLGIENS